MKIKTILFLIIIFFSNNNLNIKDYPVVNKLRLKLTREYSRMHYGIDSYKLTDPRIIVIHYTAINSLKRSLEYFKPAIVWNHRKYIKKFGNVNVGVH